VARSGKLADSEGVHWQVCELSEDSSPSELQPGGWLYFFSRDSITRGVPGRLVLMDWPGLERLCRHARPPARPDAGRARERKIAMVSGQGAEL
jgi:hypothetical protein